MGTREAARGAGASAEGRQVSRRIRTIKPEWLTDETLAACSADARVLSIGLILLADDEGRGIATPAHLAAEVFRYELTAHDCRDAAEVSSRTRRALDELSSIGFARVYQVAGKSFYALPSWSRHQRIDRPTPSRIPPPPDKETPTIPDTSDSSSSVRRALDESSSSPRRSIAAGEDRIGEDQERIGAEVESRAGAREAPPPPPPVGRAGSVRDRPPQAAEHAYAEAVKAAGGLYVPRPSEDAPHFRAVGEAAQDEARRTRSTLTEVLAAWATRWRQSRRTAVCRPAYWAEWVQSEQSRGANRPVEPEGSASWIDDVPDESIFPE